MLTVLVVDQFTPRISIIKLKANTGPETDPSRKPCVARTLRGEGFFEIVFQFRFGAWVHRRTLPKQSLARSKFDKATFACLWFVRKRPCACLASERDAYVPERKERLFQLCATYNFFRICSRSDYILKTRGTIFTVVCILQGRVPLHWAGANLSPRTGLAYTTMQTYSECRTWRCMPPTSARLKRAPGDMTASSQGW